MPVSASGYIGKVSELVEAEETIKNLSSPFYVAAIMEWKDRRKLLLKICGDIDNSEVIAANPELAPLTDILEAYTLIDYRKLIDHQLKSVNETLKNLPIRIDEAAHSAPDITGLDESLLKARWKDLKADRAALCKELDRLASDDEENALLERVKILQHQIAFHKKEFALDVKLKRSVFEALKTARMNDLLRLHAIIGAGEKAEIGLRHAKEELADLDSVAFIEPVCRSCGQALPERQQKEAAAALEAETDAMKNRLEGHIKVLSDTIEKAELAKKSLSLSNSEWDVNKLEDELQAFIDAGPAKQHLFAEKEEATAALETYRENKSKFDALAIDGQIDHIDETTREIAADIGKIERSREADTRIAELKAEKQSCSQDFMELSGKQFMIESFIREKVAMLESNIVGSLGVKGLNVKMFHEQVNGGLTECCEFTLDGVPYHQLSHSQQINLGISLVALLSGYYKRELTLFVDNSEAVVEFVKNDIQLIKLVVSRDHKDLTLVKDV